MCTKGGHAAAYGGKAAICLLRQDLQAPMERRDVHACTCGATIEDNIRPASTNCTRQRETLHRRSLQRGLHSDPVKSEELGRISGGTTRDPLTTLNPSPRKRHLRPFAGHGKPQPRCLFQLLLRVMLVELEIRL